MLRVMKHLCYGDRLRELRVFCLEKRGQKGVRRLCGTFSTAHPCGQPHSSAVGPGSARGLLGRWQDLSAGLHNVRSCVLPYRGELCALGF